MRILHVITTLDTGGAERLIVDLLPLLNKKEYQVDLLLFNGVETPFKKELVAKDIKIYELSNINDVYDRKPIYNPLNIIKLRSFLCEYDIIHTHNTACQIFVPIARLLSKSQVKLVTTEHNSTGRRRSIWWLRLLDKWIYSKYDEIVCIGDSTRDNLIHYLGRECQTHIIYNGIDIHRFFRLIKDISQQSHFVITMVAGFRPQKDQDTLIKAFKYLPNEYRLQLVGEGVREDQLKLLCNELNLEERVLFMGARMDVPSILEQSDVVVLSSHWEGLSLSSIEGMASGRPFVASDVDGLRDVVSGAGVLFPHGDEKALAESIQQLCENPSYYTEVAQACQNRAKEYDISVMADKYDQLYKELMLKK